MFHHLQITNKITDRYCATKSTCFMVFFVIQLTFITLLCVGHCELTQIKWIKILTMGELLGICFQYAELGRILFYVHCRSKTAIKTSQTDLTSWPHRSTWLKHFNTPPQPHFSTSPPQHTYSKLYIRTQQVESTISHLVDSHFFVQIRSAVLQADPLPN